MIKESLVSLQKQLFLVGPALLETGMSQEKPEHLDSAPARPFPKLTHYTAMFSLVPHLVYAASWCPLPQRSCCTACRCNAAQSSFHAHTRVSLD